MRSIVVAIVVLGFIAVGLWWRFGTVEPCGVLRERIRETAAANGGGFGGFVASAMPDSVLNAAIAANYGSATPGACLSALLGIGRGQGASPTQQASHQPGLASQQDRSAFIESAERSCLKSEMDDPATQQAGYTEAQIGRYCECAAEKAANVITPDEVKYINANHAISATFRIKTQGIAQTCRAAVLAKP